MDMRYRDDTYDVFSLFAMLAAAVVPALQLQVGHRAKKQSKRRSSLSLFLIANTSYSGLGKIYCQKRNRRTDTSKLIHSSQTRLGESLLGTGNIEYNSVVVVVYSHGGNHTRADVHQRRTSKSKSRVISEE